jgi:hypothetical protein
LQARFSSARIAIGVDECPVAAGEPTYGGSSMAILRTTTLSAALLALSLAVATGAAADTIPLGATILGSSAASEQTCSAPLIERPFVRFGDRREYVMAPDGSFEGAALPGWGLARGATRVTEPDPVDLGASDGAGLLALPKGASAISPVMCVDLDYPTFRLLTKAVTGKDSAELKIEIVYPDAPAPQWVELAKFDGYQFTPAGAGWRLTSDMDMKPDLGGNAFGFRRVAFRFTALSGGWRIDDLYVDPRRRA